MVDGSFSYQYGSHGLLWWGFLCPAVSSSDTSLGRTHLDHHLMATLDSTISGSMGDTLIGTESNQLISGGTGADSIGSQYSSSSLLEGNTLLPTPRSPVSVLVPLLRVAWDLTALSSTLTV